MTAKNIPYEFVVQRAKLGWNEIQFGLDQQLIKPKAAIDKATEQLCGSDAAPKELVELAGLAEYEPVFNLVSLLAKNEVPPSDVQIKAKWLYIVLAWLFENRESMPEVLEIVELVYSDFDYPKDIAPFVRYMPMDEPDCGSRELNEARMIDHWKSYLKSAGKQFEPTRQ